MVQLALLRTLAPRRKLSAQNFRVSPELALAQSLVEVAVAPGKSHPVNQ